VINPPRTTPQIGSPRQQAADKNVTGQSCRRDRCESSQNRYPPQPLAPWFGSWLRTILTPAMAASVSVVPRRQTISRSFFLFYT
jgi:hypothetical protein